MIAGGAAFRKPAASVAASAASPRRSNVGSCMNAEDLKTGLSALA
jgi:hypothetical protein